MKKLITIASLLMVLTAAHSQQRVTKDSHGNYVVAKRDSTGGNKATGRTITTNAGKYPVYLSSRGKLFYYRVSNKGNTYKVYLKEA